MISISVGDRFRKEVLDKGLDSTLPCYLSDKWLCLLSAQAKETADGRASVDTTEVIAALLHVISAKYYPNPVSLTESELFDYFLQYQLELCIEEVRRKSHSSLPPTTIV